MKFKNCWMASIIFGWTVLSFSAVTQAQAPYSPTIGDLWVVQVAGPIKMSSDGALTWQDMGDMGEYYWTGLTVNDLTGEVFIVDSNYGRIRRRDPATGVWEQITELTNGTNDIEVNSLTGEIWVSVQNAGIKMRDPISGVWHDMGNGSYEEFVGCCSIFVNPLTGEVWSLNAIASLMRRDPQTGTWEYAGNMLYGGGLTGDPFTGELWSVDMYYSNFAKRDSSGNVQDMGVIPGNKWWSDLELDPHTGELWALKTEGPVKVRNPDTGTWGDKTPLPLGYCCTAGWNEIEMVILDDDQDGIAPAEDNCPYVQNPDQNDLDGDGEGDVCDADLDGDSVANLTDNCIYTSNPTQTDTDQDGVGDACSPNEPDISISPESHIFSCVFVGNSSPTQAFTISNGGYANLIIGTVSLTGSNASEFSIQSDNCSGQPVTPSGDCTVSIIFSPLSEGSKSASIGIPSDDPDTPTLFIQLNGTGVGNILCEAVRGDMNDDGLITILDVILTLRLVLGLD